MISDYQSLRQAIREYLDRTDLDNYIPLFVQHAELEMNRLRLRENEAQFNETMVGGEIELPANYLAARELYVDTNPRIALMRASPGQRYRAEYASGRPKMYAREGTKLIFSPRPDSDYTVRGIYWARALPLQNGPDTNWALQYYPTWFLYECLAAAAPFTRDDDRIMVWKGLAESMKEQIVRDAQREHWSGPMVQRRA
jgi:hypothetical protein